MNIPSHRERMYDRNHPNCVGTRKEFIDGVKKFLEHVSNLPSCVRGKIQCSCLKCWDKGYFLPLDEVRVHLYRDGFKPNY